MFNVSYKKVGGLHFVRFGRFGFSWYISKNNPSKHPSTREAFDYRTAYDTYTKGQVAFWL